MPPYGITVLLFLWQKKNRWIHMPNLNWSQLTKLQLGRYAEYYAKMEFASYGFEVYTSEVDDHGVDFVVKKPHSHEYYQVQVKSIRNYGYIFIQKNKMELTDHWLLCMLRFVIGDLPEFYIIPATTWNKSSGPFANREYDKEGQTSKPEWGINVSKKNLPILSNYDSRLFFEKHR